MEIVIGEYLKVIGTGRVFKIDDITSGRGFIPDGWPIDKEGMCVNPIYCVKYDGATSVLNQDCRI